MWGVDGLIYFMSERDGVFNIWRIGLGASYEKFDDLDQYNGFVRFIFGEN